MSLNSVPCCCEQPISQNNEIVKIRLQRQTHKRYYCVLVHRWGDVARFGRREDESFIDRAAGAKQTVPSNGEEGIVLIETRTVSMHAQRNSARTSLGRLEAWMSRYIRVVLALRPKLCTCTFGSTYDFIPKLMSRPVEAAKQEMRHHKWMGDTTMYCWNLPPSQLWSTLRPPKKR